jgi:hypothetical protein
VWGRVPLGGVPAGNIEGLATRLRQVLGGEHGDPRPVAAEGFDRKESVKRTTAVLSQLSPQSRSTASERQLSTPTGSVVVRHTRDSK